MAAYRNRSKLVAFEAGAPDDSPKISLKFDIPTAVIRKYSLARKGR